MIKRLGLFTNTAETELNTAMVDKSHQKIKYAQLRKIYRSINNQKYMTNLLSVLKKNFKSSSYTLRIKSLIVLHYMIKKSLFKNERLIVFAQEQLNEMRQKKTLTQKEGTPKEKKKVQIENQQKQYIQKNIIEFYILYLLKYMAHSEAYCSAKYIVQNNTTSSMLINLSKMSPKKPLQTTSQTKVASSQTNQHFPEQKLMQYINNGFQILNLINFIIQSQQSFNKMGRYYNEHEEILNLFIMYLDDLTIYNDYTKKLAKLLTKSINLVNEEQIKHCFLYLTESQKTSDRLYQFYYNRYYYTKVKKLIVMPTFLTIQNDDFERVVKEIKKVDRQLLQIVKESKFSQQYRINKTLGCMTEPDQFSSTAYSHKFNKTLGTKMGHRRSNTSMTNEEDLKRNKRQIQQNISRYIETFDDIYDDADEGDMKKISLF